MCHPCPCRATPAKGGREGWRVRGGRAPREGKAGGEGRRGKCGAAKINSGRYKHPASCAV